MGRGAWQTTVHGIAQSWTWLKQLSTAHTFRQSKFQLSVTPPLLSYLKYIWIYVFLWRGFMCPYGEGNGNPLQYSCLEKPMDGGAWQTTVHGVAKSRTRLSLAVVNISCSTQDLVPWPEIEQESNRSKKAFFLINFFLMFGPAGSCCTQSVSSCGEQGLLFIVVLRLFIGAASLISEHRL